MDIIKKITRAVVSLMLIVNLAAFGFMAWPTGMTALELKNSGIPVVITAIKDAVTQGDIYELDTDRAIFRAILRLDTQLYTQYIGQGRYVEIHPDWWRVYVITGDLAREISRKTNTLAFTDPINHVVIFLAVSGANPIQIIAHEFTHVLQAEDSGRVFMISKIEAEYEAEVISRFTTSILSDLSLTTYPIHGISKIESLKVRRYLALMGV